VFPDRIGRQRHLVLAAALFLLVTLLAGCGALTPGDDGNAAGEPSIPTPFQALVPEATSTPTPAPASPSPQPPASPAAGGLATATATPAEPSATPDGQAGGDGAAESCEPTPPDQLGPFYVPNAPQRASVGQGHVLQGVVRSAADCAPIPGARIELWLAGPNGQYDDDHRATVLSDSDGAYRFESNAPPPYGGRPPHIHVRVTATGYETLVTQYYPQAGQAEGTFDLVLLPEPGVDARAPLAEPVIVEYPVPAGSRPHDVAPAVDGGVWYTAQGSGELGYLAPATGETRHIALGQGSSPHGVIVGPDGAPWITDSGLNAIVRVDPASEEVQLFPLPAGSGNANLNTAAFDGNGVLWFTGQNGVYGRLDPGSGAMEVFDVPRGRGPYGIAATPDGAIYYASLAGSYIARVDTETGEAMVLEPPTPGQGARRVWSDSTGRLWVSEWNAGQLSMYDPASQTWRQWPLPGDRPQPYAVYVDDEDMVWLSDFGANALVRFDPAREEFEQFVLPSSPAAVRQILGRPGEVWGAESGVNQLVVVRTR
jgi:virginiamycin B lyase